MVNPVSITSQAHKNTQSLVSFIYFFNSSREQREIILLLSIIKVGKVKVKQSFKLHYKNAKSLSAYYRKMQADEIPQISELFCDTTDKRE